MPDGLLSCSVIIPTHNRSSYLRDAVLAVQGQQEVDYRVEIIVVDNSSTDETHQVVQEIALKGKYPVRYVFEPRLGLHYSRHTGARNAVGDILVFIDDDIYASPDWLHNLLRVYQDFNVHSAGGRVLPIWECDVPEWVPLLSPDYLSLLDMGIEVREIGSQEGINGCNFSIRKDILFGLRGFNPDGFADPESNWFRGDGETGLIRKVQKVGGKVLYVGDSLIHHRIPACRLSYAGFLDIVRKRSSSQAYSYLRNHGCSLASIASLIVGGIGLYGLEFLKKQIQPKSSIRYTASSLHQVKYLTMIIYAVRAARMIDFRRYILKSDYMDD